MNRYRFGSYELDEDRQILLEHGKEIPLQPKTMQLLTILVKNAGRTMTKDELISAIWGAQVINENNLSQRILQLRRVLGEIEGGRQTISTVPSVGFRFNLSVERVPTEREKLSDRSPGLEVAAPARRRLWPLGQRVLMISLILGGVLLAFIIFRRQSGQGALEEKTGNYIATISTLPGTETFPALSPDGQMIAFSWDGDQLHNVDIYVKMVEKGEMIRVTSNPSTDQQVTWSPDGKNLAFLRNPQIGEDKFHLIMTPAFGGVEREVGRVWGGLEWSPDGKWLAVSDNERRGEPTGIYLLAVDGSSRQAISQPTALENVFDTYPSFSPDGRQIVFVRWISDAAGDLFVVNIDDGRRRQLTFDRKSIKTPKWSADGREILFISNRSGNSRLWRIPAVGGEPSLVGKVPLEAAHLTVARKGSRVVFTQPEQETTIEVYNLSNLGHPCQINSSRPESAPQISPDGRSIVFESSRTGWNEIWTAEIDCGNQFQVTRFSENTGGSPRWSPDGTRIAFGRFIDGQSEICLIGRDGSSYQRLTNHPQADVQPAWSRDGRSIYFSSNRTGRYEIYRIPAEGGVETKITSHGGSNGIESFDGTSLIYTSKEILHRKNMINGEESPIPELREINVGRNWELTPLAIFYARNGVNGPSPIYRFDLQTRKTNPIEGIRKPIRPLLPAISVSSAEDRLAISYLNFSLGDLMLVEDWR